MSSLYEKKIDLMLDKMFGEFDLELKQIMKLTLLQNQIPDSKIEFTNHLLNNNYEFANAIDNEMTSTLDENGNIVNATPIFNFCKVIENQEFTGSIRNGTPVNIEIDAQFKDSIIQLTTDEKIMVKDLLYDV